MVEQNARLMPEDAYPKHPRTGTLLSETDKDKIDQKLRELQKVITLPAEPGKYMDDENEIWTLHPDGDWTDPEGEYRDARYTPMLLHYINDGGSFRKINYL